VVLWPEGGGWPLPNSLADALGLVGGFAFALNNVLLRRESHRPPMARALAMFLGGCSLSALLALCVGVAAPQAVSPCWIGGAFALALMSLLGNLALQYGAARLRASVTAVVLVSEVLFAAVSALLLGAGQASVSLAVGGALIVAATLLAALRP
jgi:drug/metabolite transporter (DMT)-like permease